MPTAPRPSVSRLMMTTSACGLPRKSRRCTATFSGVLGAVMSGLLRSLGRITACSGIRRVWAADYRFSWVVVAVGAADPVVGVSKLVLGDVRGTVVRREHQVLLEDDGPELPPSRGLQAAA